MHATRIQMKSKIAGIDHCVKGSKLYYVCYWAIAFSTCMVKIGTIIFMDHVYILKDVGIQLQQHKDFNLYVKC